MTHVSVGLSHDLYVDKFIDLVKVSFEDNVQISLTLTNRRHHEVTNDIFNIRWVIYDSKAEAT